MIGFRLQGMSILVIVFLGIISCGRELVKQDISIIEHGDLSRPPLGKVGSIEWVSGNVLLVDKGGKWLTVKTQRSIPITLHVHEEVSAVLGEINKGDKINLMIEWEKRHGSATIWNVVPGPHRAFQ